MYEKGKINSRNATRTYAPRQKTFKPFKKAFKTGDGKKFEKRYNPNNKKHFKAHFSGKGHTKDKNEVVKVKKSLGKGDKFLKKYKKDNPEGRILFNPERLRRLFMDGNKTRQWTPEPGQIPVDKRSHRDLRWMYYHDWTKQWLWKNHIQWILKNKGHDTDENIQKGNLFIIKLFKYYRDLSTSDEEAYNLFFKRYQIPQDRTTVKLP